MKYHINLIFVVLLLAACSTISKNQKTDKISNNIENCIIYNENINIDFEVYQIFESEFNDYFSSSNKLDILHFTSWQGQRTSQCSRLYINELDRMFIHFSDEGIISSKTVDNSINIQIKENLSPLNIAQICKKYRSSSFVNFYFIKIDGTLILKYYANSSNYNELGEKDKKSIESQMELLMLIDEYAPHYYPSSPVLIKG